jgi:isocitrate dehydrogenase
MMLRYLRWTEAADLVMKGVVNTIACKELTFDLARMRKAIRAPRHGHAKNLQEVKQELEELVPGATLVGTSGFGDAVIRHMDD